MFFLNPLFSSIHLTRYSPTVLHHIVLSSPSDRTSLPPFLLLTPSSPLLYTHSLNLLTLPSYFFFISPFHHLHAPPPFSFAKASILSTCRPRILLVEVDIQTLIQASQPFPYFPFFRFLKKFPFFDKFPLFPIFSRYLFYLFMVTYFLIGYIK